MRLSAIGDEIGTTLEEQIESLKLAHMNKIEIRKINDKYLWEFTEEELKEFKKILDRENIEVLTIDSPVGKKPIPYSRKVELFDIYLNICKIFDSKILRIFSNLGKEINEDSIKIDLHRVCEKAEKEGIKLIMENERATFAESPVDCLRIFGNEKNIEIVYDLENAFFEGHDIFESYEKAKEKITYIHLRDFDIKGNKYEYLGEGDFQIERFMNILKNDGFNGVISIETHLPMNNSGKSKRELFMKSMDNFYNIVKRLNIAITE